MVLVLFFFIFKNSDIINDAYIKTSKADLYISLIVSFSLLEIIIIGIYKINKQYSKFIFLAVLDAIICTFLFFPFEKYNIIISRTMQIDINRFFSLHSVLCILSISLSSKTKRFKYKKYDVLLSYLFTFSFISILDYGLFSTISFYIFTSAMIITAIQLTATDFNKQRIYIYDRDNIIKTKTAIILLSLFIFAYCNTSYYYLNLILFILITGCCYTICASITK